MKNPSLERMIEDLEGRDWVIADILPSVGVEDRQVNGYLMRFTYLEDARLSTEPETLGHLLGRSAFETYQSSIKECVALAWNLLTEFGSNHDA